MQTWSNCLSAIISFLSSQQAYKVNPNRAGPMRQGEDSLLGSEGTGVYPGLSSCNVRLQYHSLIPESLWRVKAGLLNMDSHAVDGPAHCASKQGFSTRLGGNKPILMPSLCARECVHPLQFWVCVSVDFFCLIHPPGECM